MRHPPVEDDRGIHRVLDGVDAGLDLGDHAAGDRPLADAFARLLRRHLGDRVALAVEHAFDVGQHEEPRRPHGGGDGARDRIAVDVVGGAVLADADRSDDRDDRGPLQGQQHLGVDRHGLADQAQVEHLLDVGIRLPVDLAQLARADQVAVLARQADGDPAGPVDRGDDLLVDRAAQNHLDDLDRRLVGHPEPADEIALDLEPLQHLADLRPAAVNHDGVDADPLQQDDVVRELRGERGIAHRMPAVFHHEGAPGIDLHVGQRLGKRGGLLEPRRALGVGGPGHGAAL